MRRFVLFLVLIQALGLGALPAIAQQTFPGMAANNNMTGQNTLAGVKIEWSSARTYQAQQIVSYMGALYQSIAGGNLNHVPTLTMYWTPVSSAGGGDSLPYTENTDNGAANDGTTNDTTANNATINGLAAGGGTAFIGDNSLYTTPPTFTGPSYWETIGLGGRLRTGSTLKIKALQSWLCMSPALRSGNAFFSWRPNCDVSSTSVATSPVINISVDNGAAAHLQNITVGGFNGTGIYNCSISSHLENVFAIANTTAGTPFESCQNANSFGYYFDDGGFQTVAGSSNPSMLFHTYIIGTFNRTFLSGNGVSLESTLYPVGGPNCGFLSAYDMLYENMPVYTTDNAAMWNLDLTGCTYQNMSFFNNIMADPIDTKVPMFKLFGGSGHGNVQGMLVSNPSPVGPLFDVPHTNADRNRQYFGGGTILHGPTNFALGLYGDNATYILHTKDGQLITGSGTGAGNSTAALGGGFVVPVAAPGPVACNPSTSGGSLADGTYYYFIAGHYTLSAVEYQGPLSMQQPVIVSGGSGSGSVSCDWDAAVTGTTDTYIFRGTTPFGQNVRYTSSAGASSFTDTGAAGTAAAPKQLYPSAADVMASCDKLIRGGDEFLGMCGNVGIGTRAPTEKLDVVGNIKASGTVTTADAAYGAGWDGSLVVPTRNSVYDKIETLMGGTPTAITVADTTDTTSFCGLFESATGDLAPKTDAGCTYNAATGVMTVNVAGNVTGSSGSATGNAGTATALAADPTDCATGRVSLGINASGTAQCETPPGTTVGDTRYCSTTATPCVESRLAIGATGDYYSVVGGIPAWSTPGVVPDQRTTTTEAVTCADRGQMVTFANAANIAASIVSSASCGNNFYFSYKVIGPGKVTFTPTTSTIQVNDTAAGATMIALAGQQGSVTGNNTDYIATRTGYATGATGSINPGVLIAGACGSGTATILGATTAMAAFASPVTYPGDGVVWEAYVTADTVTVKVCAIVGLTPTASVYNTRLAY